MIALLLAAPLLAVAAQSQTPAAPAPVLGAIGPQALPAKGCAAYLWSVADRQLVAMAVADPATLRIAIGGRTVDLARTEGEGSARLGFAGDGTYRGGDVTVRLTMDVVQQEGLTAGARVPTGALQIDRTGQDGIVIPVAGLIGCRG